MISVNPVRGVSSNCFQDLIISVAVSWERAFSFIFFESLNIQFDPEGHSLIGPAIKARKETSIPLLQEYVGMNLQKRIYSNSEEAYGHLVLEIENGNPVIIYISSFWNPWGNPHAYQRINDKHFVLVTGIDNSSKELICIDPTFSQKQEFLPLDHFMQGNNGTIFTIHKVVPKTIIVKDLFLKIAYKYGQNQNSEVIKGIAQHIGAAINFAEEFNQKHDFWACDFFQMIDTIYFARIYFYETMRYICEINKDSAVQFTLDELRTISEDMAKEWEIVQKSIIKNYILGKTKNEKKFIQTLSNRIGNCAILEAKMERLIRTIEKKNGKI
ncbi:C39 family peptidase [Paenibacillus sp. NPDC057967]|uniref:C39 family peptidase n=1 Tax=Paenibacillus sp. NPDC057967 TaxID=3346293 RepID=UPI0036DCFC3C